MRDGAVHCVTSIFCLCIRICIYTEAASTTEEHSRHTNQIASNAFTRAWGLSLHLRAGAAEAASQVCSGLQLRGDRSLWLVDPATNSSLLLQPRQTPAVAQVWGGATSWALFGALACAPAGVRGLPDACRAPGAIQYNNGVGTTARVGQWRRDYRARRAVASGLPCASGSGVGTTARVGQWRRDYRARRAVASGLPRTSGSGVGTTARLVTRGPRPIQNDSIPTWRSTAQQTSGRPQRNLILHGRDNSRATRAAGEHDLADGSRDGGRARLVRARRRRRFEHFPQESCPRHQSARICTRG